MSAIPKYNLSNWRPFSNALKRNLISVINLPSLLEKGKEPDFSKEAGVNEVLQERSETITFLADLKHQLGNLETTPRSNGQSILQLKREIDIKEYELKEIEARLREARNLANGKRLKYEEEASKLFHRLLDTDELLDNSLRQFLVNGLSKEGVDAVRCNYSICELWTYLKSAQLRTKSQFELRKIKVDFLAMEPINGESLNTFGARFDEALHDIKDHGISIDEQDVVAAFARVVRDFYNTRDVQDFMSQFFYPVNSPSFREMPTSLLEFRTSLTSALTARAIGAGRSTLIDVKYNKTTKKLNEDVFAVVDLPSASNRHARINSPLKFQPNFSVPKSKVIPSVNPIQKDRKEKGSYRYNSNKKGSFVKKTAPQVNVVSVDAPVVSVAAPDYDSGYYSCSIEDDVICAAENNDFIILDSGANRNLINDPSLFSNLILDEQSVLGAELETPFTVQGRGDVAGIGSCLYKESGRNLLSYAELEESGFDIQPIKERNITIRVAVTSPNGNVVEFHKVNKLFRATMAEVASKFIKQTIVPTNIQSLEYENTQSFRTLTVAEARKVETVERLHCTLNHPSASRMIKLIGEGHLLNCHLTQADVENWYKIKQCVHCIKAKIHAPPAQARELPTNAILGKYWEIDFLFVPYSKSGNTKSPYFIAVESITGYTWGTHCTSRSATELKRVAREFREFTRLVFPEAKTLSIYSDNEKVFNVLKSFEADMERAPQDTHAYQVERKIQTIKSKFHAKLEELKARGIKLKSSILHHLITHIIMTNNITPIVNKNNGETSYEVVHKKKVDLNDVLKFGFGDVGIAKIPNTQLSEDSTRGEYAMIIGMERTSPNNLIVLLLSSGEIARRSSFVLLKDPAEAMKAMTCDDFEYTDTSSVLQTSKEYSSNIHMGAMEMVQDDGVKGMSLLKAMKKYALTDIQAAILSEFNNLITKEVMTFYKRDAIRQGIKILPSMSFIKPKYKLGVLSKLKFRICVMGNLQEQDSYDDTAAPTVSTDSLFLTLALNKCIQGELRSTDVACAFLNADLKEDIYMSFSRELAGILVDLYPHLREYVDSYNGCIYVKLLKSLYGLRQSPSNWYQELSTCLIDAGFNMSLVDKCLFFKHEGDKHCIICIHVDDLLVCSNSHDYVVDLERALSKYGEVVWEHGAMEYLGMNIEVMQDKSVKISMSNYLKRIGNRYKTYGTPEFPSNMNLFKRDKLKEDYTELSKEFKSQLMELSYATKVRVDVLKEIGILASMSQSPDAETWKKLERVRDYLISTADQCIVLGGNVAEIHVYTDAAHAVHDHNGRGHSGIYITLGVCGGPILVKSKSQDFVCASSTEAEMHAMSEGVKRARPLSRILYELGFQEREFKIHVHNDNQSTITLAKKGEGFNTRAKHFRVRFHWICEMYQFGELFFHYCKSEQLVADYLTKPMTGIVWKTLVKMAMNCP
jgi:uncharacterized protein YlbG (UPF0298 family)